MRYVLVFFALVLGGQTALATKIPRVSLDDMYEHSTVVAFGRIEQGRILKDDCGVEYAVRIARAFKGAKPGTLVWFQGSDAQQIGTEYFFFLNPTEAEFAPRLSSNSFGMGKGAKNAARCKGKRPALTVSAFGWGAMRSPPTNGPPSVPREVVVDSMVTIPPKVLAATQLRDENRYDYDRNHTALDAAKFTKYLTMRSQGMR